MASSDVDCLDALARQTGGVLSYGSTTAALWDDRAFRQLGTEAKLLWYYLMTGPEAARSSPGLLQVGIAGLAETMRVGTTDIANGMAHLEADRWLVFDGPSRLVRVLRPVYRPAPNHKVVQGWWRHWRDLPEHPYKHEHLPFLRALITSKMMSTWQSTFGAATGELPDPPAEADANWLFNAAPPELSLPGMAPGAYDAAPRATNVQDNATDTGLIPISHRQDSAEDTHCIPVSEPISENNLFRSLATGIDIHSKPDTTNLIPLLSERGGSGERGPQGPENPPPDSPEPDVSRAADGSPPQHPQVLAAATPMPPTSTPSNGDWLAAAVPEKPPDAVANAPNLAELWEFQERLRAEVPGMIPRPMGRADLERVSAALEQFTDSQLRHAQRVFAAQARASPEKRRYFDGVNNWSPRALTYAVGMSTDSDEEENIFSGSVYET